MRGSISKQKSGTAKDRNPKVLVFVTVKNAVNTIEKCLDSLLGQDYPAYDILVIDAYSTDGTYEILERYAREGKIKLVRLAGFAGKAINWVIANTDADIIAMTDADCVVPRHWLRSLLDPLLKNPELVATAGPMLNPPEITGLAKTIGEELEWRFKSFKGRFVLRSPTASFAFRRNIARKIKLDESLKVAFETDFGYNLSKFGKILFVPEAYVYHYHRSTWKDYFNQQKNYARYALRVYLKHPKRLSGDHITKGSMILEVLLLVLTYSSAFLSIFFSQFRFISFLTLSILLYIWIKRTLEIKPSNPKEFLAVQLVRAHAWLLGLIQGVVDVIFLCLRELFSPWMKSQKAE